MRRREVAVFNLQRSAAERQHKKEWTQTADSLRKIVQRSLLVKVLELPVSSLEFKLGTGNWKLKTISSVLFLRLVRVRNSVLIYAELYPVKHFSQSARICLLSNNA